jgi:glucose-6-phosphate 1-dehydrogenase
MSTLKMNFDYNKIFKVSAADAYQRLLLDAMAGDQTLFTRFDAAEISWKLLTPVLENIEKDNPAPLLYPAGAESFRQADELIEKDSRKWREIAAE